MNWLKYSGVFVTIVLNPFHWRLGFASGRDELMGPKSWFFKLNIIMIGINVVIDDGSW